jgi:hypothetical protein
VKADRYNAKALVNRANCLFIREEYEAAKEVYLEAIGVEADCVEAIYNLGLVNKRYWLLLFGCLIISFDYIIVSLFLCVCLYMCVLRFFCNINQRCSAAALAAFSFCVCVCVCFVLIFVVCFHYFPTFPHIPPHNPLTTSPLIITTTPLPSPPDWII